MVSKSCGTSELGYIQVPGSGFTETMAIRARKAFVKRDNYLTWHPRKLLEHDCQFINLYKHFKWTGSEVEIGNGEFFFQEIDQEDEAEDGKEKKEILM